MSPQDALAAFGPMTPKSWLAHGVIFLDPIIFVGNNLRLVLLVVAHEESHALLGLDDGQSETGSPSALLGDDPRNPAGAWGQYCLGVYDHDHPGSQGP